MDNLSDQLLSKVFQNLVDITDFRNCRLISQKWRRLAVEACRNKFHVVYPLTNSTLHTVSELKAALVSFSVYSFTGEDNKALWPTSGIEPLLQTTEWLQFCGSEVTLSEILKILRLAHNSVKLLSFKCLEKELMHPFLEMQETFSALRKISIGYYNKESPKDAFTTFTNTLEKWNSMDCRVQLPLLENLNLYFDGRPDKRLTIWRVSGVTTEDLFQNYIAIAKLLLKYKQTLKDVQIKRVFYLNAQLFCPFPVAVGPKLAEMERGLEALDDLNLNRLQVYTRFITYQTYDRTADIELLGRPKNLKNLLYNNLLCPDYYCWSVMIPTLSSCKSVDGNYLTSIKISLVLLIPRNDPTMAVNLGGLSECRNLRTLCFKLTSEQIAELFVKNVELLPKGISTLHFERSDSYRSRDILGMEILVNQQQIRWIIDNLRGLESFRMCLLIPEQTNANENNARREGAAGGGDNNGDVDNAQPEQEQPEDRLANRLANITLDMFRDLIAMPKMGDLRVGMMKARALSITKIARPWLGFGEPPAAGRGTTLDVIREYSGLGEAAGYTTTTTTSPGFGADNLNGFATLSMLRKLN